MNPNARVETENNILGVEIVADEWEQAWVQQFENLSGSQTSRKQSLDSQISYSKFLK